MKITYESPVARLAVLPPAGSLLISFSVDGGVDDFNSGHLFVPDSDYSGYDEDELFDDSF